VPYPKRLLKEGEDIALDLRPHWWFFSKHILTAIPLLILLWLSLQVHGTPGNVFKWFWALVAVAWAVWLGIKYLDWNFTHFVVTTERVVFRTGVLAKHGVEIPMDRISNINFHQGIWERLIGAGDLQIQSAGTHGTSEFEDVWHPDGVQQEIYRQMEAFARQRAAWSSGASAAVSSAPTAAAGPTIPDQIRELADLRDRGLISSQEFETKKAQLLERM
jgi:uncharacterized membrane protein YdbT with pleckstrin-like domain